MSVLILWLSLTCTSTTIPTNDALSPCGDASCDRWRQTADFWEGEAYTTFDDARLWERRTHKENLEVLSLRSQLILTSTPTVGHMSNASTTSALLPASLALLGGLIGGLLLGLALH